MLAAPATVPHSLSYTVSQILRFAWLEARSCAFAVIVFAGLAISNVVPLPIARYDALLIYVVVLTALFWGMRLETGREVLAILGFHVVGLAFELFKVAVGSWSYPEEAVTKLAGVPLYSGFMYAAVGSYVIHAWKLLDLGFAGYRRAATAAVAVLIYANFFTHHWLPDMRALLACVLLAVTWRTWVFFTVGAERYRMPLSVAFLFIGGALWLAENLATLFSAWRYPDQADAWTFVHVGKVGSWTLLVTVSFVLVASWKQTRESPTSAGASSGA